MRDPDNKFLCFSDNYREVPVCQPKSISYSSGVLPPPHNRASRAHLLSVVCLNERQLSAAASLLWISNIVCLIINLVIMEMAYELLICFVFNKIEVSGEKVISVKAIEYISVIFSPLPVLLLLA